MPSEWVQSVGPACGQALGGSPGERASGPGPGRPGCSVDRGFGDRPGVLYQRRWGPCWWGGPPAFQPGGLCEGAPLSWLPLLRTAGQVLGGYSQQLYRSRLLSGTLTWDTFSPTPPVGTNLSFLRPAPCGTLGLPCFNGCQVSCLMWAAYFAQTNASPPQLPGVPALFPLLAPEAISREITVDFASPTRKCYAAFGVTSCG